MQQLFQDSLTNASTLRANIASAKKLAVTATTNAEHESFCEEFKNCTLMLLCAKKGLPGSERVIKFIRGFMQTLSGEFYLYPNTDPNDKKAELLNPLASFLIEFLFFHLSKGFTAKDKTVRYRVCQLTALLLEHLEEADADFLSQTCLQLYHRSFDKDPAVRSQAVIGLTVIIDSVEDSEKINSRFHHMIQYDPFPNVRRACVWNLPLSTQSTPFILSRTRDTDPLVRKSVYLKILNDTEFSIDSLSKDQKGQLLSCLFDRDENVKKACLKCLVEKWVGDLDVYKLLDKVDVTDPSCTEAALKAFFLAKNVYFDYNEKIWNNLTPNTSFLLRVYASHCRENKLVNDLENSLPNVVNHVNLLKKHFDSAAEDVEQEFIFGQLLLLTEFQDYTDELGRREMLSFLRELLCVLDLPIDVLQPICRTILLTSNSKQDFIDIMIDIMHTVYDQNEQNTSNEALMKLMKCLDIVSSVFIVLEPEYFAGNQSLLDGIINSFIMPAINSKQDALIQEAMAALGSALLLNKSLAISKSLVFVRFFDSDDVKHQEIALKVLFDVVSYYGFSIFSNNDRHQILDVFKIGLESSEETILTLCVHLKSYLIKQIHGITKLFLFNYIDDEEILLVLIISYFHTVTSEFIKLRQTLTYFFGVYPFTRHQNQKILSNCVIPCLKFLNMQEMDLLPVCKQMFDWIDCRRLVHDNGPNLHEPLLKDMMDDTEMGIVMNVIGVISHYLNIESMELMSKLRDSVHEGNAMNAVSKCLAKLQIRDGE